MKSKVLIMTDSTSDLSKKLLDQRKIVSVPLYVNFTDEIYRDGIDLTTEELYQKVTEKGMLPTTSAVSPGDFIKVFQKYINLGYEILYMGIGAKISGTYQSAIIAKDEVDPEKIHLIDSMNLSSGIGLLVLKACDLRDQGLNALEIKEQIEKLVPLVRSQFAISTLDYLHKGGRASGTAKLMGTILGIKPIIKVVDGKLDVYKKPAGKMSRALDIMLNDFFLELDNLDLDYVFVTHSLANKQAVYMMDKIKEKVKVKHLYEGQAGCVIGTHCGAGTIGILYIVKS
ncbi:MAG: DegV family protein [Acholeplasmataceae bacterium]|nr:DegV family protein [Acholeplasmataceae bacterium]